jgi:hypothetical protein
MRVRGTGADGRDGTGGPLAGRTGKRLAGCALLDGDGDGDGDGGGAGFVRHVSLLNSPCGDGRGGCAWSWHGCL